MVDTFSLTCSEAPESPRICNVSAARNKAGRLSCSMLTSPLYTKQRSDSSSVKCTSWRIITGCWHGLLWNQVNNHIICKKFKHHGYALYSTLKRQGQMHIKFVTSVYTSVLKATIYIIFSFNSKFWLKVMPSLQFHHSLTIHSKAKRGRIT